MPFIDNSWFWLLVFGVLYLVLFLLIYLDEGFSTLAIVTLVAGAVLFLFALITGVFIRVGKDVERSLNVLGNEIKGRLDIQKKFIGLTFDALRQVGDATFIIGKSTVGQSAVPFKSAGKELGKSLKSVVKFW